MLIRDVGAWLVPDGDAPISEADHLAFLDHLAALHAAFWGWTDDVGLTPLANRFFMFSPWMLACEEARGFPAPVPVIARDGWAAARRDSRPGLPRSLEPLRLDPSPLVDALERTPQTFVPRRREDGQRRPPPPTAARSSSTGRCPGRSAGCLELAHHLALNRARIPPGVHPGGRRSPSTGPRSNGTGSTPRRGGSASSRWRCSGSWCCSAGRRRSARPTSSPGGRRGCSKAAELLCLASRRA